MLTITPPMWLPTFLPRGASTYLIIEDSVLMLFVITSSNILHFSLGVPLITSIIEDSELFLYFITYSNILHFSLGVPLLTSIIEDSDLVLFVITYRRRKSKDWLALNQNNVFRWDNISIHRLLFQ
jgi:hypothetical protein